MALPGESVPLHVFEDRYRMMIEECLLSEREFGIVWSADGELKPVGCACRIEQTLERMEDGRLNILVRGTRPFRLLERQDDLPYPAAVVEFLSDQARRPTRRRREALASSTRSWSSRPPTSTLEQEELEALDAYRMAATVEFGSDAKQELLELRSENARLRLLGLLLRAAMKRLELVERAQTRARSNGKVRFG